ncbi:MAG: membrane dipeptidase [Betaproteobacteria bacterium]|nr:membrane dipeptidase [Betaproteobacteria bacterium]
MGVAVRSGYAARRTRRGATIADFQAEREPGQRRCRAHRVAHPDKFRLVYGTADVDLARSEGKLGITFNFQGTNVLGNDVGSIEVFYRLGVRHIPFAYNQLVGDAGCAKPLMPACRAGGRTVIREMNRRHGRRRLASGHRTSMEAMSRARLPASSASNAYRYPHYREIPATTRALPVRRPAGWIGINLASTASSLNDMEATSES